MNIEEVKSKILTDELKKSIDSLGGNGTYPIGIENAKAIVKNNKIVTITT